MDFLYANLLALRDDRPHCLLDSAPLIPPSLLSRFLLDLPPSRQFFHSQLQNIQPSFRIHSPLSRRAHKRTKAMRLGNVTGAGRCGRRQYGNHALSGACFEAGSLPRRHKISTAVLGGRPCLRRPVSVLPAAPAFACSHLSRRDDSSGFLNEPWCSSHRSAGCFPAGFLAVRGTRGNSLLAATLSVGLQHACPHPALGQTLEGLPIFLFPPPSLPPANPPTSKIPFQSRPLHLALHQLSPSAPRITDPLKPYSRLLASLPMTPASDLHLCRAARRES